MLGLGMGELIIIGALVVLLFGSKKLPELGKGVGEAIREFKKASNHADSHAEAQKSSSTPPRITDSNHT